MKKIFAIVLSVALMSSCVSNAKYKRTVRNFESRIDEMEWQIQELEDEKNELEDEKR